MIILFDLDSTLVSVEWCDILAERKWVGQKVSHITQQTMNGEMDFDTAFPKKLEMISPSLDELDRLWQYLTQYIHKDWIDIIDSFHSRWYKIGILSQWYTRSTISVAKILNIPSDRVFAINFIHTEDGWFKSLDMSQDLMYHNGKKKTIEMLYTQYPEQNIVFVGDSVGDMEAGDTADLFIWYTGVIARPKVVEQCTTIASIPSDVVSLIDTFIS